MSRTHGQADTYVGDELRWKLAIVIEHPGNLLTVKAHREERPGVWDKVLQLTEVSYLGRQGDAQRWSGKDANGDVVEITTVPRRRKSCCGG